MLKQRGTRAFVSAAVGVVLALAVLPGGPAAAAPASQAGQVYTFGQNSNGQAGAPTSSAELDSPTLLTVPGATGSVVRVGASRNASYVITSTGQLLSFGAHDYIGRPGPTDDPVPGLVTLPGATGAVAEVAGGKYFTLALTSTGQIYSWGFNIEGELGRTTGTGAQPPGLLTLPGATGPAVQVAAGSMLGMAITSTGQLFTWGDTEHGELGRNAATMADASTPGVVTLPGATGPVTMASGGDLHTLALTSTGQVYGWGVNSDLQLGRITPMPTDAVPGLVTMPVTATGTVVQISAGFNHSMATTSTGQLFAWGDNATDELANAGSDSAVPVLITLPGATGGVRQGAALALMSEAVTTSGQLYSWGDPEQGDLGRTGDATRPALVVLPPGATVDGVAQNAQTIHTVLLMADPHIVGTFPTAEVGAPFAAALTATGGAGPFRWTAVGLPPGFAIDPATGVVSGTFATAGDRTFTLAATDHYGARALITAALLHVVPSAAQIKASLRKALPPHVIGGVIIPKLLKNKAYTYKAFPVLTPGTLTVTWAWQPPTPKHHKKPKPVVIAAGKATFAQGGPKRLVVRLTAKGLAKLRTTAQLKATVTGVFTRVGGQPVTATKSVTLLGPLITAFGR